MQACVLTGDLSHPNICWSGSTAGHKKTRRFQECIVNSFWTQVIKEHFRRDTLLELRIRNKKELAGDRGLGLAALNSVTTGW